MATASLNEGLTIGSNASGFVEVPVFTGVDLRPWLDWMENRFLLYDYTDLQKLAMAHGFIYGEAEAYIHQQEWFFPSRNWQELKQKLLLRFGERDDPERIMLCLELDLEMKRRLKELERKQANRVLQPVLIHQTEFTGLGKAAEIDGAHANEESTEKRSSPTHVSTKSVEWRFEKIELSPPQSDFKSPTSNVNRTRTDANAVLTIPPVMFHKDHTNSENESVPERIPEDDVSVENNMCLTKLREAQLVQENNSGSSAVLSMETVFVQHEKLIPHSQVSIFLWEPSLRFCTASLDFKVLPSVIGRKHQTQSQLINGCVSSNARNVFDTMPLRSKPLKCRPRKLFFKTWWFKFKRRDRNEWSFGRAAFSLWLAIEFSRLCILSLTNNTRRKLEFTVVYLKIVLQLLQWEVSLQRHIICDASSIQIGYPQEVMLKHDSIFEINYESGVRCELATTDGVKKADSFLELESMHKIYSSSLIQKTVEVHQLVENQHMNLIQEKDVSLNELETVTKEMLRGINMTHGATFRFEPGLMINPDGALQLKQVENRNMLQYHETMISVQRKAILYGVTRSNCSKGMNPLVMGDTTSKIWHKWRSKYVQLLNIAEQSFSLAIDGASVLHRGDEAALTTLLVHVVCSQVQTSDDISSVSLLLQHSVVTDWKGLMSTHIDRFLLPTITSLHVLALRGITWQWCGPNDPLVTLMHVQPSMEVCFKTELLTMGVTLVKSEAVERIPTKTATSLGSSHHKLSDLKSHGYSQRSFPMILLSSSLRSSLFFGKGVYKGILTCLLIVDGLMWLLSPVCKTDIIVKYLRNQSEETEFITQCLLQAEQQVTHTEPEKGNLLYLEKVSALLNHQLRTEEIFLIHIQRPLLQVQVQRIEKMRKSWMFKYKQGMLDHMITDVLQQVSMPLLLLYHVLKKFWSLTSSDISLSHYKLVGKLCFVGGSIDRHRLSE